MDFLRELVSGKKNRFKNNTYNLDLTYVTTRLIAMSFPASGTEKLYRNNIDDVAKFLRFRHENNFYVYNLSNRSYNYEKFDKRVNCYKWEDHHSPPIDMLFQICEHIHCYLKAKPQNTAVVHCKAGKGRTGTIICCYLLFSGRFVDPDKAMQYYKMKRFSKGGGVTQPSQVRYVRYFHEILNGSRIYYPVAYHLQTFTIQNAPKFGVTTGIKPYIEIYKVTPQENVLVFGEKGKFSIKDGSDPESKTVEIKLKEDLCVVGDILIKVSHQGKLNDKLVCRFAFNTALIGNSIDHDTENATFGPSEVDPDSIPKDSRYRKDFNVILGLKSICECDNKRPFDQRCEKCNELIQSEKPHWDIIHTIVKEHNVEGEMNAKILLFGDWEGDDVDLILSGKRKKSIELTSFEVVENDEDESDTE